MKTGQGSSQTFRLLKTENSKSLAVWNIDISLSAFAPSFPFTLARRLPAPEGPTMERARVKGNEGASCIYGKLRPIPAARAFVLADPEPHQRTARGRRPLLANCTSGRNGCRRQVALQRDRAKRAVQHATAKPGCLYPPPRCHRSVCASRPCGRQAGDALRAPTLTRKQNDGKRSP